MIEDNKKINYQLSGVTFVRCKSNLQGNVIKSSKNKKYIIIGSYTKIAYNQHPHVFAQQLESALRKIGCWVPESVVDQDLDLSKITQPEKD